MKIGEIIRKERLRQGLSLDDLSSRAGVNLSTLRRIEVGITEPKVRTVTKIVRALNISYLTIGDVYENEDES